MNASQLYSQINELGVAALVEKGDVSVLVKGAHALRPPNKEINSDELKTLSIAPRSIPIEPMLDWFSIR